MSTGIPKSQGWVVAAGPRVDRWGRGGGPCVVPRQQPRDPSLDEAGALPPTCLLEGQPHGPDSQGGVSPSSLWLSLAAPGREVWALQPTRIQARVRPPGPHYS